MPQESGLTQELQVLQPAAMACGPAMAAVHSTGPMGQRPARLCPSIGKLRACKTPLAMPAVAASKSLTPRDEGAFRSFEGLEVSLWVYGFCIRLAAHGHNIDSKADSGADAFQALSLQLL